MISFFVILFFIIYSVVLFLISNLWVLIGATIFNILLIIVLKIKFVDVIKNLCSILVFTIVVFLFNIIFDSVINSLIVCAKIIIVCNFSFIISKTFNVNEIAEGISTLLYPLKLFKVDVNEITLMIVIALNFISIIKREALSLKTTLKARNINFNLKTLFTKTHIIFTIFFANILKRVDMLETTLKARGF